VDTVFVGPGAATGVGGRARSIWLAADHGSRPHSGLCRTVGSPQTGQSRQRPSFAWPYCVGWPAHHPAQLQTRHQSCQRKGPVCIAQCIRCWPWLPVKACICQDNVIAIGLCARLVQPKVLRLAAGRCRGGSCSVPPSTEERSEEQTETYMTSARTSASCSVRTCNSLLLSWPMNC
jgi:hypothetical protein